ncbi:hypothetical protein OAR26_00575 [Candidatus Marinimicrobia bacterium]|mgnify:FL=1|jgi:hypothetical protein|nr:hypothetical protein [Candidatus Neomarinimicrobiota bacterium]
MSKHVQYLAPMNRIILYTLIIGTCFFVSHIAINGTNQYVGRELVKNISYKLPDGWEATSSDKQFRLLEVSLNTNEEFSLVVFNNIQGTADQNIDRWISQFKQDETFDKNSIIIKRDSLDSKYVTSIEMYGTYEVPRMGNNTAPVVVQSNYGLLGGVVEFPNSLYFLKAVGSNDLIKENSVSFEEFLYSIELN